MDPIRVLVTGAGSGVGQGIVKSLRASDLPIVVISCDISPFNAALYRTDESILLPRVEDEGSLEIIIEKLKVNSINILMIGSEFDLNFFAEHKYKIERETGVMVVVSPPNSVEIGDDKWLTSKFLKENNLPYAESHLTSNLKDAIAVSNSWGYPLILKTRSGTSNRCVHIVKNSDEIQSLYHTVPFPMLQKLINMPTSSLDNEYSCSIFKCADGTILGPFTARRTLRGGSSWLVEVDEFKELFPLLIGIGKNLETMGSLNIQLLVGEDGPIPFEFNTRFSGTTAVRAHYGFNEPEMVIRSYYLKQKLEQPIIRKGIALRYLEEVFIEGVTSKDLGEPFPKGTVRPWI